jgi:hypothetical protein
MKDLFNPVYCAKCGALKMDRPDNVPFCSVCEKKILEEAKRLLGHKFKGKLELKMIPKSQ